MQMDAIGYLRLPQVLKLFPVSKSTWWQGVKEGRFPAPVKLTERTTAWRVEDIHKLIVSVGEAKL
jgi:prophage regulatory protein